MKALITFSRLFVGSLFIVSGLIKANDPLGFSYKLEEYFAETALNLPFLEPWALLLAVLACVAEIVLGFAVLFGGKMRLATGALLGLTLFFGWLTAYTATCDPNGTYTVIVDGIEEVRTVTCVTDCGCFGDAMKGSIGRSLTPWESFMKDMILLVFIIPLFIKRKSIKLNTKENELVYLIGGTLLVAFFSWVFTWYFPVLFTLIGFGGYYLIKLLVKNTNITEWAIAGWVTLMSFGLAHVAYNNLPLRDYRPYAEGKSITEGMKTAEELGLEGPKYGYNYTLDNKSTGESIVITDQEYIKDKWWEKLEWEMNGDKTEQVKLKDGYEAPIHEFMIMNDDGDDLTYEILSYPKAIMVVCYDVEKATGDYKKQFAAVTEFATKNNIELFGASASAYEYVNDFRHNNQAMFPMYGADAIMLKTVVRSNPGLVYLENGVVKGKWHISNYANLIEQ